MPTQPPDLDALLAHSGWVRALASSLVTDPSSADDIEQQAWQTALENPPKHNGNLRSWWASVVRSTAGMGWREQDRRRKMAENLNALADHSKSDLPEDLAERIETFQRLASAVVQLPEPYAATIYLRYFEELTVREVAKRTEVPIDTAQSRIGVGLEHLRTALQQDLGAHWQSRCQALALPIASSTWTLGGAVTTAAIAVTLTSVLIWSPWDKKDDVAPLSQAEALVAAVSQVEESQIEIPAQRVLQRSVEISNNQPGPVYSPASNTGFLVTVVDGNGQKKIPDAEVIAIDMGRLAMAEEQLLHFANFGVEDFLTALGKRYRLNQSAQVRIPAPKGKLLLIGRTHHHYGFLRGASLTEKALDGEDILLTVDRVETICTRVIDEEGNPVQGAMVGLSIEDSELDGMIAARTNADGFAWLKILARVAAESNHKETYVQLNLLTPNRIQVPVELSALAKEPIVFIKPPTGRVELRLQKSSGALVKGKFLAGLGFMEGEGLKEVNREGILGQFSNGHAVFPYVALNQKLHGMAMPSDSSFQSEVEGLGPTVEGETVVLQMSPTLEFTFLTGRVLNTEGLLAKNLNLKLEIAQHFDGRSHFGLESIQTDQLGRFRFPFLEGSEPVLSRSATVIMHKTKRKPRRIAEAKLPQDLPLGELDLGDFVVEVPPLLVAGRILTATGEPVPGAKVQLQFEKNSMHVVSDQTAPAAGTSSAPVIALASSWNTDKELTVTSQEDGSFKVYARDHGREWRLEVSDYNYKSIAQEFSVGSSEVEVRILPTMTVRGRLLFDSHIPSHGIYVSLLSPMPSAPDGFFGRSISPNPSGDYEFTAQDVGNFALRVQSVWTKEEFYFLELQALAPANGSFVFPDIDLRGQLHCMRATVVDEKGQLVPRGHIWSPRKRYLNMFEFQPLALVSKNKTFDLEFSSENKKRVVLRGVTGNQKVVLPDGIPATIVVDNIDLVPRDWDLFASIHAVENDGSLKGRRPGELKLNSKGVGKTRLAWSGKFVLSLSILHQRNHDSIRKRTRLAGSHDTTTFAIMDHMDGQEIHVQIDQSKLTEALREAREYEQAWDARND